MCTEGPAAKKVKITPDPNTVPPPMGEIERLDQRVLDDIDACQSEIDAVNERASEEIVKIEQRFNILRKPFFEKRNELISGIPSFWLKAFTNHPDLNIIEAEEEDCIQHLNKLEVEEFEDLKSGYRIKFYFNENPYFENPVLTKEFHLGSASPRSHSTLINWKEGRSLARANQGNPPKNRKRRFEGTSFFDWFSDNTDATNDDIGEIIKDDLWHNPLQYYLLPDADDENEVDGECSESSEEEESNANNGEH